MLNYTPLLCLFGHLQQKSLQSILLVCDTIQVISFSYLTHTFFYLSLCFLFQGKRSILKASRSLSECHADDITGGDWSSMDSNESTDEHTNSKKTVRFSDVVHKKIFR